MKKIFKKSMVMILLLAMTVSVFSGCNLFGKKVKEDPNAAAKLAESKQYVWKLNELYSAKEVYNYLYAGAYYGKGMAVDMAAPTTAAQDASMNRYIRSVNTSADRVYICVEASGYSDDTCEYFTQDEAFSMKFDGTDKRDEYVPTGESSYNYDEETGASSGYSKSYNNWSIDKDGNHYYYCYEYRYSYGPYTDDYSYDYSNEEYMEKSSIVKFDSKGNLLKEAELPEEISYVSTMKLLDNGQILVGGSEALYTLDQDLNVVKKIGLTNFALNSLNQLSNGRVIAIGYNTNDYMDEVRELNLETGTFGEKLVSKVYLWDSHPGKASDLIIAGNTGIYSYNFGDEEQKLIMDFIDSDLPNTWFSNIVAVDDTHMLGVYSDYDDNSTTSHVVMMTKVPPEEVKDKVILEIACLYPDSDMMKNVVNFNKTNEEYRFRIRDYSIYESDADWDAGVKKLNNDIIAGNTPDILVYNTELAYNNYVSKGLFTDIRKLMDEDEEFNREDYLENVLDAFTIGNVCYTMPVSFSVQSMAMKSSLVDKYPVWNAAAMKDLWEQFPSAKMYEYMTREGFIEAILAFAGSDYVDWNKGTCDFTGDEFKAVIDLAKKFPEVIEDSDYLYDDDYWAEYDMMYRNNKVLACNVYLSSLKDLRYTRYGQFGEAISLVGYPSSDGKGSFLNVDKGFSIISKGYHQDVCWDFIKQNLTPEAQEALPYSFPVYKKAYDKLKKDAMERTYWEDSNGNREYYEDYYYVGNEQIVIPTMTEAEVEEVYNFITSVDNVPNYDAELTKIVYEEAGAYWSGQKSLDDVCKVIQSRARTYISENM